MLPCGGKEAGMESDREGMQIKFTKMQGCGNDYIYINGFVETVAVQEKPELARKLSDRHFGVGGDGVIFINPSGEADFEMEMYNADGSRSEMCGNGIRCVGKYVYDKGMTDAEHITVASAGQRKELDLKVERDPEQPDDRGKVTQVRVNMGSPILEPSLIPVQAEGSRVVDEAITVDGRVYRMTCVSMGNPHAVVFVKGVEEMDLRQIGPLFENHPRFPNRVNTEFVEIIDRKTCRMRVWERGTGETLACGTGSCATVAACILNHLTENLVTVKLSGGELLIEWDTEKNQIYMTGPAVTVFEGSFSR